MPFAAISAGLRGQGAMNVNLAGHSRRRSRRVRAGWVRATTTLVAQDEKRGVTRPQRILGWGRVED
jgi:hypothetical protein